MEKFVCPRCGNSSPESIGIKNGLPYCRLCLPFQGQLCDNNFLVKDNISLKLDYPLSENQKRVSDEVLKLVTNNKNALIHAVTGAGKTELVYASMEYFLKRNLHVGFATPRKDVVVDLIPRIKEAFPSADVIGVYGEHSFKLNGDIILLTTHQLYRYPKYFDLLILDEIDAFPYKDNLVLNRFFYDSVKGNYVLLSATPSKDDLEKIKQDNGEVVTLFERYHHSPLPLPVFEKHNNFISVFLILRRLKRYKKENKPVFIFAPTIDEGKRLFALISIFFYEGSFVSSKEESRRLNIEKFKDGEFSYLVTTSILERGVTVRNLQVLIYDSCHPIYNKATLVQIAGRVGRKIGASTGDVIFFGKESNQEIEEAIYEIDRYNRKAHLL